MLAAPIWPAKADLSSEEQYLRLKKLRYPVMATPKIDGIRCVTLPSLKSLCSPVSRTLKPIPNAYVRYELSEHLYTQLDGELVTCSVLGIIESFNDIQSKIMSEWSSPDFKYLIFDCHIFNEDLDYRHRCELLEIMNLPDFCLKLLPTTCEDVDQLLAFEAKCHSEGYEGICFRTPDSPYKCNRSTLREQYLVKMKRFITSKAIVIGFTEEFANCNPETTDALGLTARSFCLDALEPKGTLGSLCVRSEHGIEFGIGTGFTAQQRRKLWKDRANVIGKTVLYRHQTHGQKDAPRIPVFKSFTDYELNS